MRYLDAHCHWDKLYPSEQIKEASALGADGCVFIASYHSKFWQRLSSVKAYCYRAYGIHPLCLTDNWRKDLESISSYLLDRQCIAIGETGLDFTLKTTDKQQQECAFRAQIALARQHHLAVICHAAGAGALERVLQILSSEARVRFMIHGFKGSAVQLEKIIAMQGMIGIGAALLQNPNLQEIVAQMPDDYWLLETDSPRKEAYVEKENTAHLLPLIAQKMATIRKVEVVDIWRQNWQNFRRYFHIKD